MKGVKFITTINDHNNDSTKKPTKLTLAESLTKKNQNKQPSLATSLAQSLTEGSDNYLEPSREEGLQLFPLIKNDPIFPISIKNFLTRVNSIIINYTNKHGETVLTRTIVKSGKETAQIRWASGLKNGRIEINENKLIEKRSYKNGKYQLTIFGSGGRLFTEGDSITFNMNTGEKWSLEEWLLAQVHPDHC